MLHMKKIIYTACTALIFIGFVIFLRASEYPKSIIALTLTLGLPLVLLVPYIIFGKRNAEAAIAGFFLSVSLAVLSILVIYGIRGGTFFTPEFSLYYVLSVVALALLAAVVEEFVFRGLILTLLLKYCRRFPLWVLLAFQAALFSAYHPQTKNFLTFIILTFAAGLFLGWTTYKTKSLWFALGFHFGWDLIIVFLTGYPSRNLGHLKSSVIFDRSTGDVNNVVFLLAVALAALLCRKFFVIPNKASGEVTT